MKEITKVSVVCQQGAESFIVGSRGIHSIKEEVIQISDSGNRSTFYVARDKDDNILVTISAACPVVVSRI